MLALISTNWWLLLIAVIIGLVTAYWIWANIDRGEYVDHYDEFDGNDDLLKTADRKVETQSAPAAAKPVVAPKPEPKPAPAPAVTKPKPVAAAAISAEKPAPAAGSKPKIAAATGNPDNLRIIKGVGPKLDALLNSLGVTRYDQIATWGAEDIAEVDRYLENFKGRITRDSWIDQAKYLAKDDIAGFERKYGKL